MPRIRTIKPEHWNDKELVKLSLPAHLLWIALWNFSDDEGIFENDINLIKSQVFPRRNDIRKEQITEWLGQLSKARFIIPFEHNGESYYIHRTFKTHQRIDKPYPSKIPHSIIRGLIQEHYENDIRSVALYSSVKERKGASNTREPDEEHPQTMQQLQTLLLAQQQWVEEIKLTHRGKNLKQAIRESWNHPSEARKKAMDLHDWKRLVNTWLANSKHGADDATEVKLGTNNQHILDQLPYEFIP